MTDYMFEHPYLIRVLHLLPQQDHILLENYTL